MIPIKVRHLGLAVLTLLVCASPALATHPDSKSEIENLKARIQALEAERGKPTDLSPLGKKITLGGLLTLEASYAKNEAAKSSSDLALATAVLSTEIQINEQIGGHVILLWEEGNGPIDVDEAVFVLNSPPPLFGQSLTFIGGKMYLPFGNFNSFMLTDPLTLELGETNNTALVFDLDREHWALKAGVFNGAADTAGQSDKIDGWVAALELTPAAWISFGAAYLSDLAESGAELVQDTDRYASNTPAGSFFLSLQSGPFSFVGEYLTTLKHFSSAVIATGLDLTGGHPNAWNLELAWLLNERVQLAARAEGAADFKDDAQRYGAVLSYGMHKNTLVAIEYLYNDPRENAGIQKHALTAQLVFEF